MFRFMILALAALAGCAPSGVADDPISRIFQWPAVMAGDDIRRECAPERRERWRFVYNGVYGEQVRVYEIEAGLVEARVFDRWNMLSVDFFRTDEFMRGATARAEIAPEDLGRLVRAVEADLPKAAGPGDHLRSDRFFWTVVSCRAGRFAAVAFTYPSDGASPFAFPAELVRFDRTGKPLNPPRAFERDVFFASDYAPNRMTGDLGPKFLLRVTETGIRPGF